ncbi:MAG: GspE/PulE/PilB domain-containing protein, partial [Acidimicrobiales bacterium]
MALPEPASSGASTSASGARGSSRRLAEILLERKLLSRDTMEELLTAEASEGVAFAKLAMARGVLSEAELLAGLAASAGYRFVDLDRTPPDASLDQLVPPEVALAHLAIAVRAEADGVVVAMADPSSAEAVKAVSEAVGLRVYPAVALRSTLERLLRSLHGSRAGGPAVAGDAP